MKCEFIHNGNIFNSGCRALVNPVNCRGVMGKGLAKEFKKRFPDNFLAYKRLCDDDGMIIGRMFTTWDDKEKVFIINFPTKIDWRKPSEYRWIESGLWDLKKTTLFDNDILSLAIPPLGCGLGGLEWFYVKKMIETILDDVEHLTVKVYCP